MDYCVMGISLLVREEKGETTLRLTCNLLGAGGQPLHRLPEPISQKKSWKDPRGGIWMPKKKKKWEHSTLCDTAPLLKRRRRGGRGGSGKRLGFLFFLLVCVFGSREGREGGGWQIGIWNKGEIESCFIDRRSFNQSPFSKKILHPISLFLPPPYVPFPHSHVLRFHFDPVSGDFWSCKISPPAPDQKKGLLPGSQKITPLSPPLHAQK